MKDRPSSAGFFENMGGHFRTLAPFLARRFRPIPRPDTVPWQVELDDETVGPVRITGRWLKRSSRQAVVCLHGLGGNVESGYMALLLQAAERANRSCLLLNCRGADRQGGDIYHSGLAADLVAALNSRELLEMEQIDLFGYSIGGHIVLRYACEKVDSRVRRVAAIGSPLDLRAAADDFDSARFNLYRKHVMDSLKEIYTIAYQRRPEGILPLVAREIEKIREWDEQVIAPRFGFLGADDYYQKESVGPRLGQMKVEGIYVGGTFDPMIRACSVRPHLQDTPLEAVWDDRAGHLGFSRDFDLGFSGPKGLEHQVLSWLAR